MKVFAETLRDINNRLDLPQPARSRVLLEIAGDLDDMYGYFRDRGEPSHNARRLALEHCDLSDEALRELALVHASPLRRFMDRFSAQAQSWWERSFLLLLLAFVAAAAGRLVLGVDIFIQAGAWVWPILVLTGGALVFAAVKFYLIFLKKDHSRRALGAGLPAILLAACANVVVGAYGYWFGLYRAAARAMEHIEGFWMFAVMWLFQSASLMLIALTAALLISLVWFALANRIARIEQAEAMVLLAD